MQESDPNTDIYKQREPMPMSGATPPKKNRKRRSGTRRQFDDTSHRKRRSKNSGLRRLLHLMRKSENEKLFWGSIGIATVVILVLIGIWQFWIKEILIRDQEKKNEYLIYQPAIPSVSETGPLLPPKDESAESAAK